jgi:hypothetical protein
VHPRVPAENALQAAEKATKIKVPFRPSRERVADKGVDVLVSDVTM